jgi:hypothetical protein
VHASDPALLSGARRDIDGVNVWPLLTGENATQPRAVTLTTEVSATDTSAFAATGKWWKLVTLAGQSNRYYPNQTAVKNDPAECLCAAKQPGSCRQPDPPQPGRTDALVTGCPVCNATHPCVYDILHDPSEQHNVAADHPEVVAKLAPLLKAAEAYYVPGHLLLWQLAQYDKVANLTERWQGYIGPCYEKKKNQTQAVVPV